MRTFQVWRYDCQLVGPQYAIEQSSGRQSFLGGQMCVAECQSYGAAVAALRLMRGH